MWIIVAASLSVTISIYDKKGNGMQFMNLRATPITVRLSTAGLMLLLNVAVGAQAQPQDAKQARPAAKSRNGWRQQKWCSNRGRWLCSRLQASGSRRRNRCPSPPWRATNIRVQLGPPILYTVRYDVAMQRPDKLRVIIPGDGPASEFYYDGKSMMAYAPAENLVAVA